ncbi:hypothetical protein HN747_04485 [archaeon]|jgi:hypothetical protein|nr:hypothetical protein [archaeon]
MGSKIKLCNYGISLPSGQRSGWMFNSSSNVISGFESPQESFEKLFSRYQITNYRGVSLWTHDTKVTRFFSKHRKSGLDISDSDIDHISSIDNMYKTKISPALKPKSRRENEDYLANEAYTILNSVLPAELSFARATSPSRASNVMNIQDEIRSAFENLELI